MCERTENSFGALFGIIKAINPEDPKQPQTLVKNATISISPSFCTEIWVTNPGEYLIYFFKKGSYKVSVNAPGHKPVAGETKIEIPLEEKGKHFDFVLARECTPCCEHIE